MESCKNNNIIKISNLKQEGNIFKFLYNINNY